MGRYTAHGTVGRPLLSWRSVFAGGLIGLAVLVLLATLWFAVGRGSNVAFVADNMEWFIGGSAIFALFFAGMLAGWLSGVRGATTGLLHGWTVWSLVLLVAAFIGIPAIAGTFGFDTGAVRDATGNVEGFPDGAAWSAFWSLLIGFGSAGLGGILGGAFTRPADAYTARDTEVRHDREREAA